MEIQHYVRRGSLQEGSGGLRKDKLGSARVVEARREIEGSRRFLSFLLAEQTWWRRSAHSKGVSSNDLC